jgi:hypothetical protein
MIRLKSFLFVVPLFFCSTALIQVRAQTTAAPQIPLLVELFTSEGCSSCPPADAWLQTVDSTQPIAGAYAIVLSEHVDYWNHDGWKDPFSSAQLTDRQATYVRALGLSGSYTPTVIAHGKSEVHLNSAQQASSDLAKALKPAQVPVTIGPITLAQGSVLHSHIDADGSAAKHNADVFAAVALDHAESQVLRGENGGRHLTHAAVVLELTKIGKLEKGEPFRQDFQAPLPPNADPKNLRLVVFVQESGQGAVLGAALREAGVSAQ